MKNSTIEWTDHTFNPWRGCTKVSPGCERCYAETLSTRNPAVLGVWGRRGGTRPVAAEAYWRQPLRWNRDAELSGERRRVFCASLADVFEDDATMPDADREAVAQARARLWALIEQTPMLDWLLLTKRPENMVRLAPAHWAGGWPANVVAMTSAEDQRRADERIPHLLRVPVLRRGLSCEPLLGPIDLSHYLIDDWTRIDDDVHWHEHPPIHWLIVGGESGPGARPMHPAWARSLRDQAQAAGVAFFFKQWGEYEPYEEDAQPPFWNDQHGRTYDGHWLDIIDPDTGGMGKGWHEDSLHSPYAFRRVGKARAGRLLDGRAWSEFPRLEAAHVAD